MCLDFLILACNTAGEYPPSRLLGKQAAGASVSAASLSLLTALCGPGDISKQEVPSTSIYIINCIFKLVMLNNYNSIQNIEYFHYFFSNSCGDVETTRNISLYWWGVHSVAQWEAHAARRAGANTEILEETAEVNCRASECTNCRNNESQGSGSKGNLETNCDLCICIYGGELVVDYY